MRQICHLADTRASSTHRVPLGMAIEVLSPIFQERLQTAVSSLHGWTISWRRRL